MRRRPLHQPPFGQPPAITPPKPTCSSRACADVHPVTQRVSRHTAPGNARRACEVRPHACGPAGLRACAHTSSPPCLTRVDRSSLPSGHPSLDTPPRAAKAGMRRQPAALPCYRVVDHAPAQSTALHHEACGSASHEAAYQDITYFVAQRILGAGTDQTGCVWNRPASADLCVHQPTGHKRSLAGK